MKLYHTITILSLSLLLNGCKEADELSGDDVPGYTPVMVSAAPVSPFTRGYIPQGMYDNFKVFAASEKDGAKTVAMDGYEVKFVSDDWTYVTNSQPLAYWSPNADRYLFTAGAPIDAVTAINATSLTLQLEQNTTGSVMACHPQQITNSSPDFGRTVSLRFCYAHCRVCVAFIKNSTVSVAVNDIKLTPASAIATQADMTYTYDWSTTPVTVTSQLDNKTTKDDALAYDNVTIPANTADAVLSATHYYCVPDADNTNNWSVSLTCDGEQKTASFVNSETWQSGKNYIYVFSLSEKVPKLVKVISQDNFFDCNDIVSGGDFSDNDMTE